MEWVTAKLPCDVVMAECDLGALTQRERLQLIGIPRDDEYDESAVMTATEVMVVYVYLLVLVSIIYRDGVESWGAVGGNSPRMTDMSLV